VLKPFCSRKISCIVLTATTEITLILCVSSNPRRVRSAWVVQDRGRIAGAAGAIESRESGVPRAATIRIAIAIETAETATIVARGGGPGHGTYRGRESSGEAGSKNSG
jgi:hypothetical protein